MSINTSSISKAVICSMFVLEYKEIMHETMQHHLKGNAFLLYFVGSPQGEGRARGGGGIACFAAGTWLPLKEG